MQLKAILAMDHNRLIGASGWLPWDLKEDLKRFRSLTRDQVVIMGKNTYLSLPEGFRPLPHRRNIILTRAPLNEVESYSSLEACIESLEKEGVTSAWIIGGAQLYDSSFEKGLIDSVELTLVDGEHQGDIYIWEFRSDFVTEKSEAFDGGVWLTLSRRD